jgi:hypothetical protein
MKQFEKQSFWNFANSEWMMRPQMMMLELVVMWTWTWMRQITSDVSCVFSDVSFGVFDLYAFHLQLDLILIPLYSVLFEHCGFKCSTLYFGTLCFGLIT